MVTERSTSSPARSMARARGLRSRDGLEAARADPRPHGERGSSPTSSGITTKDYWETKGRCNPEGSSATESHTTSAVAVDGRATATSPAPRRLQEGSCVPASQHEGTAKSAAFATRNEHVLASGKLGGPRHRRDRAAGRLNRDGRDRPGCAAWATRTTRRKAAASSCT